MIEKSFISILIFFLVYQSSVDEVVSIHCFECDSRFDPRCLDPFSLEPFGLADCEKIAHGTAVGTMCRKIVYGGNIYRSCYHHNPSDANSCYRLNDRNRTLVDTESCDVCTDDGCNSAIKYMPSVFVIAAISLLTIL